MKRESSKPAGFVVAMWLAAVALSLLSAPAIETWLVHDQTLGSHPVMQRVASALVDASERLGASALSATVDRSAERAKPDAIWLRARREPASIATITSEPIAVAGAPAPASHGQRRAPLVKDRSSPLQVLLIGASSIQLHYGIEIEKALRASYRDVVVERFGKLSTGLVRPDYFDWQKKTKELLAKRPRDVVIAQFGGNDAQAIAVRGKAPLAFATPEWDAEFSRRVAALASLVHDQGGRLIVLGMPMMREPKFSRRMEHVNRVMKAAVEKSGGTYLSIWELSGKNGAYSNSIELDGKKHLLRDTDGVHFTRAGAIYMTRKTLELLERELVLLPVEKRAIVVRREVDSKALGRRVPYLAYVPEPAARGSGDLPVLFLLHGAEGSHRDWSDHAQRTLQALAVEHNLVIVTPEGGARGWYLDTALVAHSDYASHIVKEVVPDVEAHLPVTRTRGIAGISAGGHGALTLALKNPGLFRAASSMSGVVDLTAASSREALIERLGPYAGNEARWEQSSARHLVRKHTERAKALPMLLTVGASDRWAPANRSFAAELKGLGVRHELEELQGGHDWPTFTKQLPRHVAWHARELRAP